MSFRDDRGNKLRKLYKLLLPRFSTKNCNWSKDMELCPRYASGYIKNDIHSDCNYMLHGCQELKQHYIYKSLTIGITHTMSELFFFQMWIPKNARCMPNIVMYWFYVLIVPCIIFSPRFERDKLFLFLDKFPTSASKGRLDNYLWLLGAVACSLHQSRGILTASCWSHNRTMWVGIEFEEMCCRHKCW